MKLHEAIEKLLQQVGQPMTTQQIADELNRNGWYQKKDGSQISAFQIHGRTKNYCQLFCRDGSTVSLIGQNSARPTQNNIQAVQVKKRTEISSNKDEHYVLDLCDKVLGLTSFRQHKFDFLLGDTNANGVASKLPVDSFYSELNLVIEYRERQHTESVKFFDQPNVMTVSGVHRGEQRKIYDERRRDVLPKHGIHLVEISFSDFNYDGQKRIIRNPDTDIHIVKLKLEKFLF